MFNYYEWIGQNGWLSLCIALVWYVLLAAGLWKMFAKAHEAGWKALIPVYRYYVMFKIAWQTRMFWVYILVSLATGILNYFGFMQNNSAMLYVSLALNIVGAIILVVFWYNMSVAYGHGILFFLGLYFLTPIFIMVLGFGSSVYAGNRYERI